jgi:gamma-glutamyltranspeptidase / glutathione hydrolase
MSQTAGGHLTLEDFRNYEVIRRKPLEITYRDTASLAFNPAPSSGGTLIAFALKLMEEADPSEHPFGSAGHLLRLAKVQQLTDQARIDYLVRNNLPVPGEDIPRSGVPLRLPPPDVRLRPLHTRHHAHQCHGCPRQHRQPDHQQRRGVRTHHPRHRHHAQQHAREEDLHPGGFHRWPEDTRITSMMAPGILTRKDGTVLAFGSGGSNRIRTAILQVILNLVDYGMPLDEATRSPRIHCEKAHLSVEHGFDPGRWRRCSGSGRITSSGAAPICILEACTRSCAVRTVSRGRGMSVEVGFLRR